MVDCGQMAAQALLHLSEIIGAKPRVKYSAFSVLVDRYLPSASIPDDLRLALDGGQDPAWKSTGKTEWSLILLAAAAIDVASKENAVAKDAASNASPCTHRRKQVLDGCNEMTGSQKYASATQEQLDVFSELLLRNVGSRSFTCQLASDLIVELHATVLSTGGLKAFGDHVTLANCLQLLDFLLGKLKFQGALQKGGKLLACGIMAGAYTIYVPRRRAIPLPFCAWLSDYSDYSRDVIRAQAESILITVLSLSSGC